MEIFIWYLALLVGSTLIVQLGKKYLSWVDSWKWGVWLIAFVVLWTTAAAFHIF